MPRPLHIVGGTYVEWCDEPRWDQLFGSGLRAAAAVSALGGELSLSTYIGMDQAEDLAVYAATFGVHVNSTTIEHTIRFTYHHPLSRPEIWPPLHEVRQTSRLIVDAPAVLRFGMLEGTGVITGGRVVYDPQSSYTPEPFAANGSRAEQLAIVANIREARHLSGEASVDAAGRALLATSGAAVVIIKLGARGLSVFTRAGSDEFATQQSLPAFETPRVFPIGSGDVFSAVFAHLWAAGGIDPITSAERASRATAYYCATKQLPIPREPEEVLGQPLVPLRAPPSEERPLVYLAGPFFTMAQRWLIREARDGLKDQGVNVFSPYHDVGIGGAEDVVPKDIEALDRCQAVLANVDGADAGTLFEVGYARAREVPVIALSENEQDEALKMLRGSGCDVQSDFTTAVYRTAWAALRAIPTPPTVSEMVGGGGVGGSTP